MTLHDLMWAIAFIAFVCFAVLSNGAAYNNGVTDGYGYAREPSNPGYRRAGRYLRKHMFYRWPELGGTR